MGGSRRGRLTLDELKKLSLKLNPVECMRLIEAIYSAIPVRKEHIIVRNTPANVWVSKHVCLEELKAWNSEYPDKSEPKARVVMFLHLNSLGRSDLANYIGKNRETRSTFGNVKQNADIRLDENHQKKIGIVKQKTNKKSHMKRLTHGVQHRRSNQYNIRHPAIAAVAIGPQSNDGPAAPGKSQPGRWNQTTSKNSLFLMIALVLVVFFICVIIYLIIRRSLGNCVCCCKRSDPHLGNNCTQEKALQCICLNDDQESFVDYETQSNLASQITEIDVEGGSSINSVDFENRKSYSDTMLHHGITPTRVSVERLNLLNEEPPIEILEESQPLSSCRCRPPEPNVCGSTKPKKKKKKSKVRGKEETKTAKSYLKAVHDKILPRKCRQVKKDCTFDTKQFQEKILAVLNQEYGVCQSCNCTLRLEADDSKLNERRVKHEKKKHKCEKLSKGKECVGNETLSCQASVVSRSPMSSKRSTRKQESDSGKKCGIRDSDKESRKCASSKSKRGKYREAIVSSSSSEIEVYDYNESKKDGEKCRKSKSKRCEH